MSLGCANDSKMRRVEEYRQSVPASPTAINECIFREPLAVPINLAEGGKYPNQTSLCREGISMEE